MIVVLTGHESAGAAIFPEPAASYRVRSQILRHFLREHGLLASVDGGRHILPGALEGYSEKYLSQKQVIYPDPKCLYLD
jgi:hypothetical protein